METASSRFRIRSRGCIGPTPAFRSSSFLSGHPKPAI